MTRYMETNNKQNFKNIDSFIKNCEEVTVSKRGFFASLFAPKYKVVCKSSGMPMKRMSETFPMNEGNDIVQVIETGKKAGCTHFSPSANGNVMVNLYYAPGGHLLMIQAARYAGFGYEPVTDVAVFRNEQAVEILQLFI